MEGALGGEPGLSLESELELLKPLPIQPEDGEMKQGLSIQQLVLIK